MATRRATKSKSAKDSDITLVPCNRIDRSGQEISFPQDEVFVKGIRVGYIGHEPGTSLCLIIPVDNPTLEKIRGAIKDKFGKQPAATLTAPPIPEGSETEGEDE